MNIIRNILCALAAILLATNAMAQDDRQFVRNGNKYFKRGDYKKAELEYRKALSVNENNTQALYNRGCALMQDSPDSALACFNQAGKMETNKIRKAWAYHNIGVIYHANQQYDQAVEAYKEALRNNPKDDQTRYNLELAKRQQKEQNGGGQSKDQNQQDQNKDKKDQNKDDQKDKNEQKKDQQQDQQQKQQQQQQISDDNAERLLDAAIQEEKRTQDKLNKAMQQPRRRILQKNW
ncbi:MAG: tetratricopeptide repeat protein [Prevotella sp.]|jgi:Ca-activated chloride channel family protein|nr:tetratricopeptide repeat protein [Prevotella sp.]